MIKSIRTRWEVGGLRWSCTSVWSIRLHKPW